MKIRAREKKKTQERGKTQGSNKITVDLRKITRWVDQLSAHELTEGARIEPEWRKAVECVSGRDSGQSMAGKAGC